MNNFYVYGHFTKNSNELFYIGKGKGERAHELINGRSIWWNNIVNKHGVEIKILYNNLTESESLLLETQLIKQYGRRDLGTGCLVNMTDGGEGSSGRITSIESRNKMSLAKTGKTLSIEHKKKLSDAHKNVSDEAKRKMSDSKRGKKRTPFSEEHKKKISEAQKIRHAAIKMQISI
jgi:hypothetical protein